MKFWTALKVGIVAALLLPLSLEASGWREMLREQMNLKQSAPDLSKQYPGLSADMAQLGEAFVRTAYPDNQELGRKNFLTLVGSLGMESPKPADLCQFLHPNKKPWDDYKGPTDGNFHMLLNSGSLALDTSDGSSKDHPAFALRRKYSVSVGQVKPIMQSLSRFIRSDKIDTALVTGDPDKLKSCLQRFREHWAKENSGEKLTDKEISFAGEMLRYMA